MGSFPNRGSNLHLLHWQVASLPWSHQGSLVLFHKQNLGVAQLLSSALTCRERTPSLRGFLAQSVRFSYRKKLRVCILVGLPLSAGRPHQLPLQGFPALGYLEPEALLHLPQQAPIVFNPRSFPGPSPSSLLPLGLHTC